MGRGRCAVVGCDPRTSLSFHRFPKEPLLRKEWLQFCQRGFGFNPESGRVCGAHFCDEDFEKSSDKEHLGPNYNKRRLKRDSLPSLRPAVKRDDKEEDADFTVGHFLSGFGVETTTTTNSSTDSNDPLSNVMFEDIPDNSSSNGSSSNATSSTTTTLRRSTRTRYATREDELVSTILLDDNSNDGSTRKGSASEERLRRSLARKSYFPIPKKGTLYDEKGLLAQNGLDICDCFDQECPGCHFPCNKCKSPKCAHECRVNRRWMFETKEIDGIRGSLIRNPYLQKKTYSSAY